MEWVGFVVGMGGLAVAGLGLFFNYHERISAHRVALYSRQFAAFEELGTAASNLLGQVEMLIGSMGAGPGLPRGPGRSLVDNETESTLRAVVINASLELSETRVRHAVFLPEAVLERVEHLEQLAAALLSPSWEVAGAGEEDPVRIYHKDPMFTFTIAQLELFNEIREQVGTDRLSESMRSLLRAPRTPQPE